MFMKNNNRGFSLLELALVMIIMGIMYAAVFSAYEHYQNQKKLDNTYETMRLIQGAFSEFAFKNKRYPCPASRTAAPGDADYGVENCTNSPPGVVIADTGRDVGDDFVPATGTESVMIGAIPYKTMEPFLVDNVLLANHTIDTWGNKYTYAVTDLLAFTSSYNDEWGALAIEDEYGDSIINPANKAHIVVFTHGPDGKGAYSMDGVSVDSCNFITLPPSPTPPPGPALLDELENCDDDDGDFLNALENNSDISYFDDTLNYQINKVSELWTTVGTVMYNSAPVNLYTNTNPGNVGIGVKDPNEKLEFADGFTVSDNVILTSVCATGGVDCMPVSAITGNEPEMQCPDNTMGVKNIGENKVNCVPIFTNTTPANGTCPAGEYMVGFTNTGRVICDPPPP